METSKENVSEKSGIEPEIEFPTQDSDLSEDNFDKEEGSSQNVACCQQDGT